MSKHKPRIYLFYEGMRFEEYYIFPKQSILGPKIYNGGYVWVKEQWLPQDIFEPVGWYRCDKTPVLPNDVPANFKAMALLLS